MVATSTNGEVKTTDTEAQTLEARIEANEVALATLNARVRNTRTYITIAAELNGDIKTDDIFSFGSRAPGNWHGGYVLMSAGKIVKASLLCASEVMSANRNSLIPTKRSICKNGVPLEQLEMELSATKLVKTLETPIDVEIGNTLFFMVDRLVPGAEWTIAAVLITSSQ